MLADNSLLLMLFVLSTMRLHNCQFIHINITINEKINQIIIYFKNVDDSYE